MSGQLGELVVSMQLEMARFREDLGKANRAANDTMTRMAGDVNRSTRAMESSLSTLSASIMGAFSVGAVIGFTRETVNAGLAAEKLNMQFKASTGSAAASAREMAYVRDLTDRLGLAFQSTATGYSKFLAATRNTAIEGAVARKTFEGVSEAATALGLSADETSGIFYALQQMMSKGKVSAEELNGQLGERLPGAMKLAADAMGLTTAELMKQMQEGKVMSADMLPKLAAELHKTYGEAAKEASTKGQAGINRFNNELLETKKIIGEKLLPLINSMGESIAAAMKTAREGDWGFQNASANLGILFPGVGTMGERFALPKVGEGAGLRERNARIAANRASAAAIASTVDPQMSRIIADRNAEQDRINASRAAAEKAAAGAATRQASAIKAATDAKTEVQHRHNAALKEQADQMLAFQNAQAGYIDLLRQQDIQMSELSSRMSGDIAGFGSGLLDNRMNVPKASAPRFSLSGASETMGYGGNPTSPDATTLQEQAAQQQAAVQMQREFAAIMAAGNPYAQELLWLQEHAEDQRKIVAEWHDEEIGAAERKAAALLKIDENLAKSKAALIKADRDSTIHAAVSLGNQMSALMMQGNKEQFERGKLLAEGMAIVNTAMGVSAALGSAAPPYNFILAGLTAAAGAVELATIQGTQYQARALGGPVNAGQTYLVGEKGPELFTAGANGQITSNDNLRKAAGRGVEVTQVFQISPGIQGTVQAEIMRAVPALQRMAVQGVKQAMRGGEFQGV